MEKAKAVKWDLMVEIVNVLKESAKGKGEGRQYMTSYQILDRLPDDLHKKLVDTYGSVGGQGAKVHFSAASAVAKAASTISSLESIYLDTRGLFFSMAEDVIIRAGYQVCAAYRLKNG